MKPISHDSCCATTKVRLWQIEPSLVSRCHLFAAVKDIPVLLFENLLASFFSVCHLVTTLCKAWRYVTPLTDTWTGWTSPYDGAAEGIDSPGEYKLASSLAPACCGPHLSAPRPGPCGSGFCVSAPQPFSSTILAISPLWARPLQSLYSQPGTNGNINFSAHRPRSVFKPIKCKLLSAAANRWSRKRSTDSRVTNEGCEGKDRIYRPHPSCLLCSEPYCSMYSRWSSLFMSWNVKRTT